MKKIAFALKMICISLVFLSCSIDKPDNTSTGTPFSIRENIEDLYVPISTTDKDKVLLLVQGGPGTELEVEIESELASFIEDYYAVMVHQINTYDENIINADQAYIRDNINAEIGAEISHMNADIIMRVAEHFKKQGKTVFLFGGSYGSLLIQQVLVRYDVDDIEYLFEKVFMGVGRIKVSDTAVNQVKKDIFPLWSEDNNYMIVENDTPLSLTDEIGAWLAVRIAGDAMTTDYTEALKDKTFDNNKFLYIVADHDDSVGVLLEDEKQFIKEKFNNFYIIKNSFHDAWVVNEVTELVSDFFLGNPLPQAEENNVLDLGLTL